MDADCAVEKAILMMDWIFKELYDNIFGFNLIGKLIELYRFGRQQLILFLLAVGDIEALGGKIKDDNGGNNDS